jgi:nucleoid-associated protein YgaU
MVQKAGAKSAPLTKGSKPLPAQAFIAAQPCKAPDASAMGADGFNRQPAPQEVKVAKGDTLSAIAGRVLGDESRWHELLEANRDKVRDPRRLAEGITLRLPGAATPAHGAKLETCGFDPKVVGSRDEIVSAVDEAEKFANDAPTTYTARKGDSLSRIAAKLLGDPSRWPEILEANPDVLKHAKNLQPGMVLKMPEGAKEMLKRNATEAGEEGPVRSGQLWDIARDLGEKHDLDPRLVMAVVQKESGGNPRARSHVGARGLMQLMPSTAQHMGLKDPYNPRANMEAGTRYLKSLMDDFGDVRLALMAYNWGPGNLRSYLKSHKKPPRETRNYVPAVLAYYRQFGGKA